MKTFKVILLVSNILILLYFIDKKLDKTKSECSFPNNNSCENLIK